MIRLAVAAIFLGALSVWAEAPDSPAQTAGRALAEQIRNALPEESSRIEGTLIIRANGQTRRVPVVCRVVLREGSWESDYDTSATTNAGAEQLIVIHRINLPNEYLYARAPGPSAPLPKPSPLTPEEAAETPLAGSDFSAGDLGLDFLHWPQQKQLKGEMRLGQPCYVLESRNPEAKSIVRVKSYIDKETSGLLIAEGTDSTERLVKEFSLGGSSFKRVHGHYQLEKMDIRDLKKHSHTELKLDIKDP